MMRAISVFSLEAGTSTFGWRAPMALRTRVSISAIGSLVILARTSLPTGFHYTWNFAAQRQLPETQPANSILAQERSGTPTAPAAVTVAALQYRRFCLLRLSQFDVFCDFRGCCHG